MREKEDRKEGREKDERTSRGKNEGEEGRIRGGEGE